MFTRLFLLVTAAWPQDGTEKAVTALEQQWLKSNQTNNPDLLAPLLADKFINTSVDGKVTNKAETLANGKKTKWESAEYEDLKVTAYGDTASRLEPLKARAPTRASLLCRTSGGQIRG